MKLFSNWDQQKPLIKYHKFNNDNFAPFFTENPLQENHDTLIYQDHLLKLTKLYNDYNDVALRYRKEYFDCTVVLKFLYNLISIYKIAKEKRNNLLSNIQRFLQESYSYVRDPLRQVCFLTKELLNFYKTDILSVIKLLKPVYASDFLSETERNELYELNNRCSEIIEMYALLNEMRNRHFQQMFK